MKKQYVSFCVTLLALAFAPAAQAQTDFRPGYIVSLAGDTVRGLADYRGGVRSARLCQFRTAPEAPSKAYRPEELRGYGFWEGKAYRSCLTPMPDSLEKPAATRRFFLEVLATGPASLLARRDGDDATHYYLQKSTGEAAAVQELVYRRVLVEEAGQRYYREVNTFRGTLSAAFADCSAALSEVSRTAYKASALVGIVNRYNLCREPGTQIKVQHRKSIIGLGIVAGVQASRLVYEGDVLEMSKGNFVAKPAPMAGLALQLISPALNEKLMLRLEALYAQQEYEDEYKFSASFPDATAQTRVKLAYLRLPVMVRYTAPRGALRPLLELGVSVSTALTMKALHRTRYTPTYGEWKPAFEEKNLQKLETGLLAGVGVQLPLPASRPLTVLGRVERSNGMLRAAGYGSSVWRYQLLLGMNLTK